MRINCQSTAVSFMLSRVHYTSTQTCIYISSKYIDIFIYLYAVVSLSLSLSLSLSRSRSLSLSLSFSLSLSQVHFNTLQHTATQYNALQRTATLCNTECAWRGHQPMKRSAVVHVLHVHCKLQRTATATHCSTEYTWRGFWPIKRGAFVRVLRVHAVHLWPEVCAAFYNHVFFDVGKIPEPG